jgi:hypothetical protein
MSHASEVGSLPLSIGRLSLGSKRFCFVLSFSWRLASAIHRLIIRAVRAPLSVTGTTTFMGAGLIRLGHSVRRLNCRVLELDSGRSLIPTTSQTRPQPSSGPHFDLRPSGKGKNMHNTNFKRLKTAQRISLVALAFLPMLLSGCAQTGTASTKQSNTASANPAMYNYNPGTRDFETRWPFGPANYH